MERRQRLRCNLQSGFGDPAGGFIRYRGASFKLWQRRKILDKPLLKSALSKIWTLVYHSTQATLTLKQEEELLSAINTVEGNWDEKDVLRGRASFVCDCARMHLS